MHTFCIISICVMPSKMLVIQPTCRGAIGYKQTGNEELRWLQWSLILTGTNEGGCHTEKAYSKGLKLTGSGGHVTLNAQNSPKLGRLRPCRSRVSSGGAQIETERTARH
jgi:hypothetical protein